jgi:hypothetical protein
VRSLIFYSGDVKAALAWVIAFRLVAVAALFVIPTMLRDPGVTAARSWCERSWYRLDALSAPVDHSTVSCSPPL